MLLFAIADIAIAAFDIRLRRHAADTLSSILFFRHYFRRFLSGYISSISYFLCHFAMLLPLYS